MSFELYYFKNMFLIFLLYCPNGFIKEYIKITCLTSRNNKSLNNSLFNSWDSEVTIPGT